MKLLEKLHSKQDATIKYIFQLDDRLIIEVSYINKNDDKDIICVPTQTSCQMKCKFCHITEHADKIIHRNITHHEIWESVHTIYHDLNLHSSTLLISYMGLGEPILNYENVIISMINIRAKYECLFKTVRFAIASIIPYYTKSRFENFIECIAKLNIDVKVHLSLHFTNDKVRTAWIPNSSDIYDSIKLLERYMKLTGNKTEIHYALIDSVNDTSYDVLKLCDILQDNKIPVKFLIYNEKASLAERASSVEVYHMFEKGLKSFGIKSEYYIPPGQDIKCSCGQFALENYLKYNVKA